MTQHPQTLSERLDLLPHDRHVRLFRLQGRPEWYATWTVRAKPITMRLGVDEHGLIAELIKQWSVSKPAPKPSGLGECLNGHTAYDLTCEYCIARASANVARKQRSA